MIKTIILSICLLSIVSSIKIKESSSNKIKPDLINVSYPQVDQSSKMPKNKFSDNLLGLFHRDVIAD